jgi:hypothetical protein
MRADKSLAAGCVDQSAVLKVFIEAIGHLQARAPTGGGNRTLPFTQRCHPWLKRYPERYPVLSLPQRLVCKLLILLVGAAGLEPATR